MEGPDGCVYVCVTGREECALFIMAAYDEVITLRDVGSYMSMQIATRKGIRISRALCLICNKNSIG